MRPDFKPSQLYERLPYGTTVPSHCPDLRTLSFDCRVGRDWIERNLENTPFVSTSDRIVITVSDKSNHNVMPHRDVSLTVPVDYKDISGGHLFLEFEDCNRAVLGGREKWGFPKLVSHITFEATAGGGYRSVLTLGGSALITMEWEPADAAPAEPALRLAPNLMLRVLPDPSRPGIGFAQVLKMDMSPDVALLEQRTGRGRVTLGAYPERELDYCGIGDLEITEIVSATCAVHDWRATEENGWAQVIDRLV